jgi:hypothetical protein
MMLFPVLREPFLFLQGPRVLVELRPPIRLDPAHRRFLAGVLLGGLDVETILAEIPDALFGERGRPTTAQAVARLAADDSFLALAPWEGPRRYDAVVVDLSRERPKGAGPIDGALAHARRAVRVLHVIARAAPETTHADVDVLAFVERKSSPVGTYFRFVQFVRSLLAFLPPARVVVTDVHGAIPLLGGLDKHACALVVDSSLTPYLMTGRMFASRRVVTPVLTYLEVLYWLRRIEDGHTLLDAVKQCSAASVAGWLTLLDVSALFVQVERGEYLRHLASRRDHVRAEILPLEASSILRFLVEGVDGATNRVERGAKVGLGAPA